MSETRPEAAKAMPAGAPQPRKIDPILKLLLEFGPLGLFFVASYRYNLHVATGVLMVGVVVALAASYAIVRRVPLKHELKASEPAPEHF